MLPKQAKRRIKKSRVAYEIMAGMRELHRMMDEGKIPEQMFTVKTIDTPDPDKQSNPTHRVG